MVGGSPAFLGFVALIRRIARHDAPVLLEGETGTGKELAGRAIHYNSARCNGPFVPVNCGALPDTLVENELFGHRRGAFTDARDDQLGLVAIAHGGTLFLDEIDALPVRAQITLLRFLQDHEYRPLGGRAEQHADIRIIAASNASIEALTAAGVFRADLMYRLKILHLRVPALRERTGDAALLAHHFINLASARFGVPAKTLTPQTLHWFDSYSWPGNVRELENLVYREFLLADGTCIEIAAPPECDSSAPFGTTRGVEALLPYREAKARAIALFERHFLTEAMGQARGSISVAARLIHTERRHLGRLLKKHGIERFPRSA
jgi:DNA-binding NtrC family response regulator